MRQADMVSETNAIAEQSYDRLDGEWGEWLAIAKRYEHKAKAQDRLDLRHAIIARLADIVRGNGDKPLTEPAMYRIASYEVADYWRTQYRHTNGLDCGSCSKAQRRKCRKDWLYGECPKAVKLEYLSKPMIDSEGNITELGQAIADDHAIDLDAWLDAKTYLLGCPLRLIATGQKKRAGIPLDKTEQKYLERYRRQEQKSLF